MHLLLETGKNSGTFPETYPDYLDKQEKQLDKIDFLIRALLKTSQPENGLIQIRQRETSIGQTIMQSVDPEAMAYRELQCRR